MSRRTHTQAKENTQAKDVRASTPPPPHTHTLSLSHIHTFAKPGDIGAFHGVVGALCQDGVTRLDGGSLLGGWQHGLEVEVIVPQAAQWW